jgi:hypothetical protein
MQRGTPILVGGGDGSREPLEHWSHWPSHLGSRLEFSKGGAPGARSLELGDGRGYIGRVADLPCWRTKTISSSGIPANQMAGKHQELVVSTLIVLSMSSLFKCLSTVFHTCLSAYMLLMLTRCLFAGCRFCLLCPVFILFTPRPYVWAAAQ